MRLTSTIVFRYILFCLKDLDKFIQQNLFKLNLYRINFFVQYRQRFGSNSLNQQRFPTLGLYSNIDLNRIPAKSGFILDIFHCICLKKPILEGTWDYRNMTQFIPCGVHPLKMWHILVVLYKSNTGIQLTLRTGVNECVVSGEYGHWWSILRHNFLTLSIVSSLSCGYYKSVNKHTLFLPDSLFVNWLLS